MENVEEILLDDFQIIKSVTSLCDNLEIWMTRLPASLRSIPIIHLAIPGSHNTMTYTINHDKNMGIDESPLLQFFGRCCSCIFKPIITNWFYNQQISVIEQLNGGIRYLDLRVATKSDSDSIYFIHGLYGAEITEPLQQINEWLSSHPFELLILDFQHFYSFSDDNHLQLIAKIKNIFNGKLCPFYNQFDHITLQWLSSEKYQLLIIYRNSVAKEFNELWSSGMWPTPWPNVTSSKELIQYLTKSIEIRSPNTGFISQCLLTPNSSYIMRNLCGNLHRNLSEKCRLAWFPWINSQKPGFRGINVVITDFVSDSDFLFSKTVIQRNALLVDHEEEIE